MFQVKIAVNMFHLTKIVKTPIVNKELAKILPVAMSLQSRNYSDHQIPERLQHIPTAANPKFFDMVRAAAIATEALINLSIFVT